MYRDQPTTRQVLTSEAASTNGENPYKHPGNQECKLESNSDHQDSDHEGRGWCAEEECLQLQIPDRYADVPLQFNPYQYTVRSTPMCQI